MHEFKHQFIINHFFQVLKIPVLACLLLDYQGYCCLVSCPLIAARKGPQQKNGAEEGRLMLKVL